MAGREEKASKQFNAIICFPVTAASLKDGCLKLKMSIPALGHGHRHFEQTVILVLSQWPKEGAAGLKCLITN
jgi:hypothetical protein